MGFQCDLYVYDHVEGGLFVGVAANRQKHTEPYPQYDFKNLTDESVKAIQEAQDKWNEEKVVEPINLPHAGEKYWGLSREDAITLLTELRHLGYIFPDDLIDVLRRELEDGES